LAAAQEISANIPPAAHYGRTRHQQSMKHQYALDILDYFDFFVVASQFLRLVRLFLPLFRIKYVIKTKGSQGKFPRLPFYHLLLQVPRSPSLSVMVSVLPEMLNVKSSTKLDAHVTRIRLPVTVYLPPPEYSAVTLPSA
jgi:hypothetical protein